jgi:hypothetical protein
VPLNVGNDGRTAGCDAIARVSSISTRGLLKKTLYRRELASWQFC